ncbi:Beta-hexosaminidase [termite gut metagenome]|uniref:beta-N-acetylhexosaminidase n=1 Tax=termite gut metagenome TaxID=433724 RepID=A0A5J4SFM8_9ZZZZ
MKKRISYLLLCSLLVLFGCSTKDTANKYNLVPQPNQIVPQKGRFVLSDKVSVVIPADSPEVGAIVNEFITRLQLTAGLTLKRAENASSSSINFVVAEGLPKEGYNLSVTPGGITITASEPNGFFYAVQTIYQLLPAEVYGKEATKHLDWFVPAVEIADASRFAYRGLMLDVTRHFASTDYIYKFIDMLAMHKMNTFHWHLTDDQGWRIEIKKYPKLTEIGSKRKETMVGYYYTNYPHVFDGKEHGGYYTQEQIKDIVAYAASKYITIIPEIELPGHASAAITAYPQLSCTPDAKHEVVQTWGVYEDVFAPTEETFKFLENVMDEVIALFPSPYIHIGGDECPKTAWKNSAQCQALIRKLGLKDDTEPSPVDGVKHSKEDKLQSYFVIRIEKYLNSKGRNIIGWDEILEGGLAPNATVMSWRGVQGGLNAAKAGHDAIMTPNPYVYLDQYQEDPEFVPTSIGGYSTLKKVYSYNPVPNDADELVKKHVIGLQGNIWTEYIQTDERRDYQAFPRGVAIAETGWTLDENKNWDSFCERMAGDFQRMDIIQVKACRNFFNVNINTRADEDGTLKVFLETYYPKAEIRYTTDGTVPTQNSPVYKQPFTLTSNINLQAAAFKGGTIMGEVTAKPLYGNLISGKSYTVTPRRGSYSGDILGENDVLGTDPKTLGLTNGKRGNNSSYIPWVSFGLGKESSVEFTVNLGQATSVKSVVFGSLYNPANFALPPSVVSVEVSSDGNEYKEVAEQQFTRQYPEVGTKAYTDSITFNSVEAVYVKVKFKTGGVLRNGTDCLMKNRAQGELIASNMYLDEVEVY